MQAQTYPSWPGRPNDTASSASSSTSGSTHLGLKLNQLVAQIPAPSGACQSAGESEMQGGGVGWGRVRGRMRTTRVGAGESDGNKLRSMAVAAEHAGSSNGCWAVRLPARRRPQRWPIHTCHHHLLHKLAVHCREAARRERKERQASRQC
jgi:hypothetical protein